MKSIRFILSFIAVLAMIVCGAAGFPAAAQAQTGTVNGRTQSIFTSKAFATATNRTDTSSRFSLSYAPAVEIVTNTVGTDSLKMIVNIDYLQIGRYLTVSDTIKFGPATTGNKARSYVLRSPYSNAIPGADAIRIRNVIVPFRSADSTSATSYTQQLIFRY